MKKCLEKKKEDINFGYIFAILLGTFLPIFSYGIFAPTEIFFANYDDFNLIYSEFGPRFWKEGILATVIVAIILWILPRILTKILLGIMWIFSICAYVQTMFLNGNMDDMGVDAWGYQPTTAVMVKDGIIWAVVAAICLAIFLGSKKKWPTVVALTSVVLIGMQGVAYASLFINANEEALAYNTESEYVLDGSERFTVSTQGNIIMFVLDSTANAMYEEYLLADYPEAASILKDFTYFSNADCCDFGTFPTMTHLLTGVPFDVTGGVTEYWMNAWNSDTTQAFYTDLHAAGYQAKVYIEEPDVIIGNIDKEMISDEFDNIKPADSNREVDYDLLDETLRTMSLYRFMPDALKPNYNVPNSQYMAIVSTPDNVIEWENADFYAHLNENGGLDTVDDTKYFICYHLNGLHELLNDENCNAIPYSEDNSISAGIRGEWTLLETYMNYLKEVGAYDNSTIMVLADHGSEYNLQPIFFIKPAGQTQDATTENNAPVTWNEFLPTVALEAGLDAEKYGQTFYDIEQNTLRERTVAIRATDYNYPAVDCYNGTKDMDHLVYHIYKYTGGLEEWRDVYWNGPYETVPAKEVYYH